MLKLKTGAEIVICNACAYDQTESDLRDFLQYLSTQKVAENNSFITKINEAVQLANANEEVRSEAMISDYKIRDAAAAARAEGQAEDQRRLAQILERNTAGLTPEQREAILKQFTLQDK